jgi:hypothetical protein
MQTYLCASETCMKDAEIMRQNARFRSSREPGGDLITLTVRVVTLVAGATVVNGVIGHCRPSQINKLDWQYN